MVFADEFSTVPSMRKGTIPPNLTDLVQLRSQSTAPDNIYLKNTWFTPYLEEDTSENLSHKPNIATNTNKNMLMPSQVVPHVQGITAREGSPISEVIKCPSFEGVQNTSNLNNSSFHSTIIQRAQINAILKGIKGIKNA